MVFKAEVLVSFRKHTALTEPALREPPVQVDHLYSLSPLSAEASAVCSMTRLRHQAEQSNPCSKSLALKVHAFPSLLKPAIHPCCVHFLAVKGAQVHSGFHQSLEPIEENGKEEK